MLARAARLLGLLTSLALPACDDATRSGFSGDDDDDGTTSVGGPSGAGGSSGAGQVAGSGDGSGAGGSSSSGGCKPGGAACAAFAECCSGICDNQICAPCAGDGASCASAECCLGLECNPVTNKCGSCKLDGSACALAAECCSNVCDNGVCAPDAPSCGPKPSDCAGGCSALWCCTQQEADGGGKLCPGFAPGSEAAFKDACTRQCSSQMALLSVVDPGDCPGTIATLSSVNSLFAQACGPPP